MEFQRVINIVCGCWLWRSPGAPGEGTEGWFRLAAEVPTGFIPSRCAAGPQVVSSGMSSGSSEGRTWC